MNPCGFICPVCGYPGLKEPAIFEDGNPSFEICPSCGVEFGVDDHELTHEQLRSRWIDRGSPWWNKRVPPPENWDPAVQLEKAGLA